MAGVVLAERVTIEAASAGGRDALGAKSKGWGEVAEVLASREAVSVAEVVAAGFPASVPVWRFTVRGSPEVRSLRGAVRLLADGGPFALVSILPDPPKRPGFVVLTVRGEAQ